MEINLIKAVIFDMDGVLVDSEPIHERAEVQTWEEFGVLVPKNEWGNFRGKKIEDIFSYVIKKYGTGKEPIEKMVERKIEIYLAEALNVMNLVPGVYKFLEKLADLAAYRLALTTSGKKVMQEQILDKFGLGHFFEILVMSEEIERWKPDPEAYIVTAKKLGENTSACLVIEDSINGICSAKNAGCIACGITTTFDREKLEEAGADIIIDSFSELEKILHI